MSVYIKLAASAALAGLGACSTTPAGEEPRGVAKSFYADLNTKHNARAWVIPGSESAGEWTNVDYSRDNVAFTADAVELSVFRTDDEDRPNQSGMYHKRGWYHYGRYEVVMKAAPGSGLMTGFLTHTDATDGDPFDQINFSFMGKNTSQVVATAFADGEPTRSNPVTLPFNAAEDFHTYAFEWSPEAIRWYVEDELIFETTDAAQVPQTPQRVILTLVVGGEEQRHWIGDTTFEDGVSAAFKCVSYAAADDADAKTCSNQG